MAAWLLASRIGLQVRVTGPTNLQAKFRGFGRMSGSNLLLGKSWDDAK